MTTYTLRINENQRQFFISELSQHEALKQRFESIPSSYKIAVTENERQILLTVASECWRQNYCKTHGITHPWDIQSIVGLPVMLEKQTENYPHGLAPAPIINGICY